MFFLLFEWLYYGAFHVESCFALCSCVFLVLFSIVITSLGEERAGLLASRAFVVVFFFARINFVLFLFLLVSRVGCGL